MSPVTLLLTGLALVPQGVPPEDSTYATAAVRELVEQAALVHDHPPAGLASFGANVETEIGLLIRHPDGDEVTAQLEQLAGRVTWRADGSLAQTVTGYRARMLGLTVSALSFVDTPWVIAPLYGDRVPVAFADDSTATGRDTSKAGAAGAADAGGSGERARRPPKRLIHPFASDRARFYRFSGGDTVLVLQLPDRRVPIVRVKVDPVQVPREALVFQGEIDLDATRHQIVHLRGRILDRSARSSVLTTLLKSTIRGYWFVDLENAEWNDSVWLPHRQWIELEVKTGFTDDRAIMRLVSDFSEIDVNAPLPPGTFASADSTDIALVGADTAGLDGGAVRSLHVASMDSLRGFADWRRELGAATVERSASAFDDVAPDELRLDGPPRLRFNAGSLSNVIRYDRVEGLFTGFGTRLDLRDAAPGASIAARAGYAWAESAVRGGVEAALSRGGREIAVAAGRELASTNDFPRAFGTRPTLFGAFGVDDFDYVDRSTAEARVGITTDGGATLEIGAGEVRDRAPALNVVDAPLDGAFRPLRPVTAGAYRRVRVRATWGGRAGGEYLTPGLSAGASWELAAGELDWQRAEAFLRGRSQRGRWTLAGEVNAGAVVAPSAAAPPPQALFELGGYAGRLPGFDYKAFTGDRAAVTALRASYALPFLEAPIRLGRVFLPATAPSPAIEVDAGWAGASPRTADVLRTYGWTDSGGVRATLFLGLRVFGDALACGLAHPIGEPGRWRFTLGFDSGG